MICSTVTVNPSHERFLFKLNKYKKYDKRNTKIKHKYYIPYSKIVFHI